MCVICRDCPRAFTLSLAQVANLPCEAFRRRFDTRRSALERFIDEVIKRSAVPYGEPEHLQVELCRSAHLGIVVRNFFQFERLPPTDKLGFGDPGFGVALVRWVMYLLCITWERGDIQDVTVAHLHLPKPIRKWLLRCLHATPLTDKPRLLRRLAQTLRRQPARSASIVESVPSVAVLNQDVAHGDESEPVVVLPGRKDEERW